MLRAICSSLNVCPECSEIGFCELRLEAHAPILSRESSFFFLPKAVAADELCAHDVRVLDISKSSSSKHRGFPSVLENYRDRGL